MGGLWAVKGGKGGSKVIVNPGPLFQANSNRISADVFWHALVAFPIVLASRLLALSASQP